MIVTVDTGGTKTLIAHFEKNGDIGDTITFPTPVKQEEYVVLLKETLQRHYADKVVDALVIALPGIIKNGVALWCNNLGWKDFDARAAFANTLGDCPLLIENDANLAGLAETRALVPLPASSLYVTISTGIGTGIITNGQIDDALRYSEGGHMQIEFNGVVREWESFASGRAIHTAYNAYARDITDESIWYQIADRISRGFLSIIPLLQPEVIIIGGSIGTYFSRYDAQLLSILKAKLPSHIPCPRLIQASHPEQAVVYGGYYYALDFLTR
jgi:predicted NBD/HSP70 family sugar kinase